MPDKEWEVKATTSKSTHKVRVVRVVRYGKVDYIDLSIRIPDVRNVQRHTRSARMSREEAIELADTIHSLFGDDA